MTLVIARSERWVVNRYLEGGDDRADTLERARAAIEDDDRAISVAVRVVPHECSWECDELDRENGVRWCDEDAVTHDVLATWSEVVT